MHREIDCRKIQATRTLNMLPDPLRILVEHRTQRFMLFDDSVQRLMESITIERAVDPPSERDVISGQFFSDLIEHPQAALRETCRKNRRRLSYRNA